MPRRIYSEKVELIRKAREAMLSAVQIFNNPLVSFKTESFLVLSVIGWIYLLHAYYRSRKIDYRYFTRKGAKKIYDRNSDGSIRYWDLRKCLSVQECPVDKNAKNNIEFLLGLRDQVEHRKAFGLDSYLSARYQACALNFNFYLKKLHGEKYGLDQSLALSLQFAELDYHQSLALKDRKGLIAPEIFSYVAAFDNRLSDEELISERFAYRLLFTRVVAKRQGQADRVIEFIDPNSEMAKDISRDFWVKEETEKPKLTATLVIQQVQAAGFEKFGMHQHTQFWHAHDGKNPARGFGVMVVKNWYWYQNWVGHIINTLKNQERLPLK